MKATRADVTRWRISGAGALGNALQGGLIFWSMGIYTSTFEDEFGAPRAQITLIESFLSIGANLFSPFVGYFVDKWSARAIMALGVVALGAGLIVASMAGTLIHTYAAFLILLPLAALTLGVMPSSTVISRWFRKRRGLALGISVAGSSVGGAFLPILVTAMFAIFGWRDALFGIGCALLVFAPVIYFLVIDRPEDVGLEQEEEGDGAGKELTEVDQVEWTIKGLLTTGQFWLQTLISATLLAVTLGLLANLSLHAKDMGLKGAQIATLYSILAVLSFGGKIVVGGMFDRLGLKVTGLIVAGLMIAGLSILDLSTSALGLTLACIPLGLAYGGVTPMWTNMIARGFGAKSYGRAIGTMNPLHTPITASTAPIAGYISDTTGSYDLVFALYIGLVIVAAVAMTQLRTPRPKKATN